MKAFLLATGEYNPLAHMDPTKPSPMMPILNRPVMLYAVELLHRYGHRDIHVCLYHLGNQVETYFEDGQRWSTKFTYRLQRAPLGSAGAIRRAKYHINDTFLVLPADRILNFNIAAALELHRTSGSIATVIAQQEPGCPVGEGVTLALESETNKVNDCQPGTQGNAAENRSYSGAAYWASGAYIFEPEVLDYIPRGKVFDFGADLLPSLIEIGCSVSAYVNDGYWNPLDTYEAYQHGQRTLLAEISEPEGKSASFMPYAFNHIEQRVTGVWAGDNVHIHPSATLNPPVYVGEGSEIRAQAVIGPNVVIGSHAVIDRGASIENGTILEHTYVGQLVDMNGVVVNQSGFIGTDEESTKLVNDPQVLASVNPLILSTTLIAIFEKVLSLLLILGALPIVAIVGILVWAKSDGPILAKVTKVGVRPNGNAVKNPGPSKLQLIHFATRDQNGVHTKIGRWLEKWDLHRLPELWNVAIGDLALVGVEPLSEEELSRVQDEWQRQRLECKVGFTGYWYTQTMPSSSFVERSTVDAYYAATRTVGLDVKQLLSTPITWMRRKQITKAASPLAFGINEKASKSG